MMTDREEPLDVNGQHTGAYFATAWPEPELPKQTNLRVGRLLANLFQLALGVLVIWALIEVFT